MGAQALAFLQQVGAPACGHEVIRNFESRGLCFRMDGDSALSKITRDLGALFFTRPGSRDLS